MTTDRPKSFSLSPEVHSYLVAHGTPPDGVQRALIEETREKLGDLLSKADRSEDLEGLLEDVLQNQEQLKKLSSELGSGADGEGGTDS